MAESSERDRKARLALTHLSQAVREFGEVAQDGGTGAQRAAVAESLGRAVTELKGAIPGMAEADAAALAKSVDQDQKAKAKKAAARARAKEKAAEAKGAKVTETAGTS